MQVFIDANIYKRLFEVDQPTTDHLDELIKLIKSKSISIIFPKITQNEVYRHIGSMSLDEKKLKEYITKLKLLPSDVFKNEEVKSKVEKKRRCLPRRVGEGIHKVRGK